MLSRRAAIIVFVMISRRAAIVIYLMISRRAAIVIYLMISRRANISAFMAVIGCIAAVIFMSVAIPLPKYGSRTQNTEKCDHQGRFNGGGKHFDVFHAIEHFVLSYLLDGPKASGITNVIVK
jgi:hypothetical protein